jgi:hypothetical protein
MCARAQGRAGGHHVVDQHHRAGSGPDRREAGRRSDTLAARASDLTASVARALE